MISMAARAVRARPPAPRTWRIAAGITAAAGGAFVITGAFLPWVETFAGLVGIPGVHGSYGRVLAAAGALVAVTGLWHAVRGGTRSRWLASLGGFAALGFSGYLLIQLSATVRSLGADSMVLASGGPGLWVIAGGALLAFATLFLPASAPAAGATGTDVPGRPVPFPAARARMGRLRDGVLRRTADLDSAGARRGLQIALGLGWLLDAALQFQPYMFGWGFVSNVLAPPSMGNPAVVAGPAIWASRLIGHDLAAWNTAFALIQLAIAVGLLWRPAVRAALIGSIAWSLSVWWLGEGLGGLLTGTASPVTGAPGAVILYALIAVLAWPAHRADPTRRADRGRPADPGRADTAGTGVLGSRARKIAWLILWGSFACLILQPAIRAPRALSAAIAGNAAGEPDWLAALDRATSGAIAQHSTTVCAALAVVFVLIAAGILHPATTRPVLVLAAIAGLAIWVLGENLGMLLTGTATDPNSGPLLVLLAAAYWPAARLPSLQKAQAAAG